MTVTARQSHLQDKHFIRFNLAFNSAAVTATQLSMGSALPANAVVTNISVNVQTAFNGTTGTVDVGTAGAPTALISGQSVQAVVATNAVPATLGGIVSSTVDTELFVRFNFTGTPTAGAATVIVEYAPNI